MHKSSGIAPRWITLTLILIAFLFTDAGATIHCVDSLNTDLQSALDACQSGDTVLVSRGTYFGQFQLPECSMHLYSRHVLTQDTLDVEETILDGEYGGSVLTGSEGAFHYDIQGFTVTHGQGHYYHDGLPRHLAGGIHLYYFEVLRLDHCVIRDCDTDGFEGAALSQIQSTPTLPRQVSISNVTLIDLQQLETVHSTNSNKGAISTYADSLTVRNLRAYTVNTEGFCVLRSSAAYYLELCGIQIHGMAISDGIMLNVASWRGCVLQDLSMSNCEIAAPWNDGYGGIARLCQVFSDTLLLTVRNVSFDTCRLTGYHGASYPGSDCGISFSAAHMDIDSVTLSNCHTDFGSLLGFGGIDGDTERRVDRISHLRVDGCSYGQEVYQGDPDDHEIIGPLVMTGMDLVDCSFTNNVGVGREHTGTNNTILSLVRATSGALDTLQLKRLRFENNLVIDRDNYATGSFWGPNLGRSLLIYSGQICPTIIMDSCQFIEQRQPNWIPERPDPNLIGKVGNTVYIRDGANLVVQDCLFQGIDDGGLFAVCEGNIKLENCQFIDVDRYSCVAAASYQDSGDGGVLEFSNVLVQNSCQHDCQRPDPENSNQHAIDVGGELRATIRNCTITGCSQINLIGTERCGVASPEIAFTNCALIENEYEHWSPEWSYGGEVYEYCMLQEPRSGTNNLVAVAPRFDLELGAPYLASDSPCIDAGDPEAAYNDIEDPDAPGFALWPSQGGLRNDIGFTGGPFAAVFETVGVSPTEHAFPSSPTLEDAYPNPFNPVTTIPFTLPRPGHFTLQAYNLRGQLVQTLADTDFPAGEHIARFDASHLASGVYLISLRGEGVVKTRKTLLLK